LNTFYGKTPSRPFASFRSAPFKTEMDNSRNSNDYNHRQRLIWGYLLGHRRKWHLWLWDCQFWVIRLAICIRRFDSDSRI